jgi:Mn-dependent DtxR family transcriptional regulator
MTIDLNSYGPGRPLLPATKKTMEEMIRLIGEDPGIRSAKLAKQVGLSSLQCAIFAKRLEKKGLITIGRSERALTYTLVA